MNQHTPGPWSLHFDHRLQRGCIYTPRHKEVYRDREKKYEIVEEQVPVAEVNPDWCGQSSVVATTNSTHGRFTQSEANARLIAAAPDLLSALEGLTGPTPPSRMDWDAAYAAIARARGSAEQQRETAGVPSEGGAA